MATDYMILCLCALECMILWVGACLSLCAGEFEHVHVCAHTRALDLVCVRVCVCARTRAVALV